MKPSRIAFEHHWLKTRGKRARNDLQRHPAQPQTYISDAANRHWVTWQAAQLKEPEQEPVQTAQTSIVFYNGNSPLEESEVLRITKEGITVNPAFQPDEAAAAVLRALGSQIKNLMTQPEQEPVAHAVVAGALFDFMGWLTSRKKRIVLSSADNASPAVEAITEFAKMRNLSLDDAKVQDWNTTTPQRKPLTDEKIEEIAAKTLFPVPFARAIEAELKENT